MSKTAKNPITGDLIKSKSPSKKYFDNYDAIFRKSDKSGEIQNDENSSMDSDNTSDNCSSAIL